MDFFIMLLELFVIAAFICSPFYFIDNIPFRRKHKLQNFWKAHYFGDKNEKNAKIHGWRDARDFTLWDDEEAYLTYNMHYDDKSRSFKKSLEKEYARAAEAAALGRAASLKQKREQILKQNPSIKYYEWFRKGCKNN